MRLLWFVRVVRTPALVLLIAAVNATPATAGHNGDDGTDPTFVAGIGLLVLSGTYAIANADYVARERGNYIIGSLGIVVGAPIAGIGALAFVRSIEAEEVSTRNVLLSAGLVATGLASCLFGGKSISYAISPPDNDRRVSLSPVLLPDGDKLRPGLVLTGRF